LETNGGITMTQLKAEEVPDYHNQVWHSPKALTHFSVHEMQENLV